MAKLSKNDVLHVAKLSNLTLNEVEIDKFMKQLSNVVGFIGNLNEVDTSSIEPTNQTTGLVNVLREDIVKPELSLSKDKAISGTDNTFNDLFKVSVVLSERTV